MTKKRELLIALTVLIIATLAFLFGWTNLFTVKNVTVSGSPNTSVTAQVLKLSDIQKGTKLARIEPKNVISALGSFDWIQSVKLNRNWISRSVDIHLITRTPIATAGNQFVDASGTLFTPPTTISAKLPAISSVDANSRTAGVAFFLALPKDFSKDVAKIAATSTANFQIVLNNSLRIIWGDNRDNALKMKIYKALLALPENSKIKLMDVSDPTKPTVK